MSGHPRAVIRTLTQERINAYADASGDHNPIHLDEVFARGTPFGGTIAHGMLTLALIGEMMQSSFGAEWSNTGRLKVRFKAPARAGDTVTASAQMTKRNDDGSVEYAVRCANERDETLIEGRATVLVAAA